MLRRGGVDGWVGGHSVSSERVHVAEVVAKKNALKSTLTKWAAYMQTPICI